MSGTGQSKRPRELALKLLDSPDLRPRQRARDQRADLAGFELERRMLERLAAIDPEPAGLEAALAQIVDEVGPPFGPTRAIATLIREEWRGGVGSAGPVSQSLRPILAELMKLAQSKHSLAASCAVLGEILPPLFATEVVETPPVIDPGVAREKLLAGIPLLRGLGVSLNSEMLRTRWLLVWDAAERQHRPIKHPESEAPIDRRAVLGTLDPAALLSEVLAGRPETVSARAEALGIDSALTATGLRLAALPVLARFAEALEPLRRQVAWNQGYCPTCGSWPLLGEFRGLEQNRFLRCGLCASGWQFSRLRCPFCDNSDFHQLGYFHVDGEETRHRAATCDTCRGYVKMISTLEPLSAPALLVQDLATLHLDLAAADRGYFVP